MKALVAGAEGQLGRALVARLADCAAWSGGRSELDLCDGDAVRSRVAEVRPDVVFNAAAYNNVDGAESDPASALAVNAAGPRHLARACRDTGALLVHVSTDYVFDGLAGRAYVEDDVPRPCGAYGVSKLAGELMVASSGCEHLIVRTSAVLGRGGSRVKGGSFVERIVAKARAGESLRVVGDQVFSPTCAPDLAAALVSLVEAGARGLVHVTNSGSCSWHGLAVAALELAGLPAAVREIRSADLGAPAPRPPYSVLASVRLGSYGLAPLRSWRDALQELVTP